MARTDYTLEPDGRRTSYTYNGDGSMATLAITPPGRTTPSHVWSFAYQNGKLASITDPAGRVTHFTVDGHGNLVQVAFPDDTTRRFVYDAKGLMTQQIDQNGAITSYSYDSYGRIRQATYPPREVYDPATGQTTLRQEVRTFTNSDTGYPLINDSPHGTPANPAPAVLRSQDLVVRVQYGRGSRSGHVNKWGAWLDETDGLGRTTTYLRDERNNVLQQTEPDGDCVTYTYDAMGNVLTESRMAAAECALAANDRDPSLAQTWTRTYEPRFNQLKTETDPLGHTTTYVYDYEEGAGEAGKLIRVEYPQVQDDTGALVTPMVRYTYNALGLLETETDERGVVTKYLYSQGTPDEAYGQPGALFAQGVTPVPGLLTKVIQDFGDASHLNVSTITRDFDGAGNARITVAPNSAITRYTFDAMGRKLTDTDALGIVTKYEYDGKGNLVRQVRDYTPDGTTGRNIVTEYTYNAHDQVLSERTIAPDIGEQTTYAYDINRNLATITDSNLHTTTYVYDDANQRTRTRYADASTVNFTYHSDGALATRTDQAGVVVSYTYDGLGRLTHKDYPDGSFQSFGYDLTDRMASADQEMSGHVTALTFAYNVLGDVTSHTQTVDGNSWTTGYQYGYLTGRTTTIYPSGPHVVHANDALGRLRQVTKDGANVATYAYDDNTGWVTLAHANGVTTVYEVDLLTRSCVCTPPNPRKSSPTIATATMGWATVSTCSAGTRPAIPPTCTSTTGWSSSSRSGTEPTPPIRR